MLVLKQLERSVPRACHRVVTLARTGRGKCHVPNVLRFGAIVADEGGVRVLGLVLQRLVGVIGPSVTNDGLVNLVHGGSYRSGSVQQLLANVVQRPVDPLHLRHASLVPLLDELHSPVQCVVVKLVACRTVPGFRSGWQREAGPGGSRRHVVQ